MKITIPYEYTAQVIPPRCRKPRDERQPAAITLTIHEVTGAEAPVAIRENYYDLEGPAPETSNRAVQEYRWFRNKLWMINDIQRVSRGPYERQTAEQFLADPYPYRKTESCCYWRRNQSKQARRIELMHWASSVLFVDGLRYKEIGEPRYVVMTFGLGCNHGIGWGTSLTTDNDYNSNIGQNRYFRADQFEQAVAAATRIATDRGDTKALPIIETQEPTRFEILIPEAIRLRPAKEHGTGDPFINRAEDAIVAARDPALAGLFLMALVGSSL